MNDVSDSSRPSEERKEGDDKPVKCKLVTGETFLHEGKRHETTAYNLKKYKYKYAGKVCAVCGNCL